MNTIKVIHIYVFKEYVSYRKDLQENEIRKTQDIEISIYSLCEAGENGRE